MSNGFDPSASPLYNLKSVKSLARILSVPRDALLRISETAPHYYRPFDRRKKYGEGKWRHIENPIDPLKTIQKQIQRVLFRDISFPIEIVGGVRGRSLQDAAKPHQRQPDVVTLDIKNFFPSTNNKKVYATIRSAFCCSNDVSSILTKLTTIRRLLPQGAPTSSAIANLVLLPIHAEIVRIAKENGLRCSFFVDDIIISGPKARENLERVIRVIQRYGYHAPRKKIHKMHSGEPQKVLGHAVNKRITITGDKFTALHDEILGLLEQRNVYRYQLQSVRAKIDYVNHMDDMLGRHLLNIAQYLPEDGLEGERPFTGQERPCKSLARHKYDI